eukprot:TRINITY_DN18458_c4_g1_i1.p1 TRINITY_DN18458_c4_g1~~TRINITY_DN18458_c4_g1_i1.p1  ORF type:complete len:469 (+),score=72.60 TRINITY_DN18458_c4_g1_i1:104-1408(+)
MLSVDSASLWNALGTCEELLALLQPHLPEGVAEALRANFAPPARWSFFELWARMLPSDTIEGLREDGGVLCPRFFLVDLAAATQSPYDIDKSYPLVRHGKCLFVGQPPMDDNGSRDAMRQGRHLEAKIISFAWLEEDHVLTEVFLPGVRAIFSAAPDAVAGDFAEEQPLAEGDVESYRAAGYSLAQSFALMSGKHERCRLWTSDRKPVPAESYVEVKKTTHLNGSPGKFKMLKFWLQAALMRCGAVVVALTEGSEDGDVVKHLHRYDTEDLAARVDGRRVWGSLAEMLQYIVSETNSKDGQWTLKVQKAHGLNASVKLTLSYGWSHIAEDTSSVLEHINSFFECACDGMLVSQQDQPTEESCAEEHGNERVPHESALQIDESHIGHMVEVYWTDGDCWLPASLTEMLDDGRMQVEWTDDSSMSTVPPDYVRLPL